MQHNGVRIGAGQQFGVDLIRPERAHPIQAVVLLTHGRPGVGDQHIGAGGCVVWILSEGECRSGLIGTCPHGRDHAGIRFETRRRGDGDMHTGGDPAQHQRMRHIVGAVTEVGQPQSGQCALALGDGLQIGQHLARMELIRQCVDHRNRCGRGHLVEPILAEGPPDDRIDIPGEHPAGVGEGLVPTELSLAAVDDDGVPAELGDTHLEGEPGAGGVLVEDDGHTPGAFQRAAAQRGLLEVGGQRQHLGLLGRRQVVIA